MDQVYQDHYFSPRVIKEKTSDYTVLVGDDEIDVTPAALTTITLPAISDLLAAGIGSKAVRIKKMDTSVQQVIITASGSDTIQGSDQDLTLSNYLDDMVLQSSPVSNDWIISYMNMEQDGEKFALIYTGTSTSNTVAVWTRHTGASGYVRGFLSQAEYAGTNVGVALNTYAIRGYAKVTGTIAGSNTAYVVGVQGRIEIASGGTMTGGKVAAVLAQVGAQAGTISGGTLYGVWIDSMQLSAKPGTTMVMLGMEAPDAAIRIDSFIYAYGKATAFIDFAGAYSDYVDSGTTAGDQCTGHLKILVGGATRYINIFSDNS